MVRVSCDFDARMQSRTENSPGLIDPTGEQNKGAEASHAREHLISELGAIRAYHKHSLQGKYSVSADFDAQANTRIPDALL